jgi:uncharacterized membrane protein
MAKIYYIGDWAVMLGPVFAETPFNYSDKGLEIYNYGRWLKEALEQGGRHQVNSVPTWDFYKLGPGGYEKVLKEYDMVIFSDVELKNFQLAPNFFNRQEFGKKVLTFPDRVRLTVDAVKAGKPMMFLGGWLSFTGEMGKGGWGRCGLKEVLPVTCMETEDLIESTEGFTAQASGRGKQLFGKVDFSGFPPILGYNRVLPKKGAEVLVKAPETGDPLVALGKCGKGKVLAYMSDPAPHWGCNFVFWKQYPDFWQKCADLLLGDAK